MRALVDAVDWQCPWLAPYREIAQRLLAAARSSASVAQLLNAALAEQPTISLAAGALRFVPQHMLAGDEPYEAFIARTALVPTRDKLHDLLNGLVWLRFPQIKRRLNELQAEQIANTGVQPTRGAVRDALTLFDENAALWQAPAALVDALRRRDWHTLFVTHRAAWEQARPVLFGHALMHKLTEPRKAITAHVWALPDHTEVQAGALALLTPGLLATRQYLPLPLLGVPGWWPTNESAAFYDDPVVFRLTSSVEPR